MSTNITVNGQPLNEYVGEQIGKEISNVRASDEHMKVRTPLAGKVRRNTSGARTMAGTVVYSPGQKEQKVMLKGTVYSWAEKGALGFVKSGRSILGGLELTADETEVKCHECGGWFACLPAHLRAHKIPARNYKIKHGLALGSTTLPPSVSRKRRTALLSSPRANFGAHGSQAVSLLGKARAAQLFKAEQGEINCGRRSTELANQRMGCMAQLTMRLTGMAAKLGRCPTRADMRAGDEYGRISSNGIRWAFQMTVREALSAIGLTMAPRYGNQQLADSTRMKILQMRSKGATYLEICRALSVSPMTAAKYSTVSA